MGSLRTSGPRERRFLKSGAIDFAIDEGGGGISVAEHIDEVFEGHASDHAGGESVSEAVGAGGDSGRQRDAEFGDPPADDVGQRGGPGEGTKRRVRSEKDFRLG